MQNDQTPSLCVLWIAAVEKVDSGEAKVSQSVPDEENLGDKYYNKAKCFFDNISSDTKPRWGKALLLLSNLNGLLMVFSMCIFFPLQENHLGGGEKVEHGNIRSAGPLPARPRIQGPGTWRAGPCWAATPPKSWQWKSVKEYIFFCFLLRFSVNNL